MAKKNISTKKFEDMTKAELLKLCESFGISASQRAKKEQIIEMLVSRQKAEEGKGDEEKRSQKPKLTGKAKGRQEQLEIREADLKKAEKLHDKPLETFMHSLDRLAPGTRKRRPPERERKQLDEEEITLMQSNDDPTFTLSGIIEGHGQTEYIKVGGKDLAFIWLQVSFGSKEIDIPTYHYLDAYQDQKKTGPKEIFSKMQKRVGAKVDFNLTEMSKDPVTGRTNYYGTTLLASKIKRCTHWYEKYTDGHYVTENGDIVDANIVEIWKRAVVVEYGGAETSIPIKEVTHRYISNIETQTDPKLKVGDTVKVKISNIKRLPLPNDIAGFDYPVSFDASIKDAAPNPQVIYFNDFKFGQIRRALVTNIKIEDNPGGDQVQYYCQVLGGKPVTLKCTLACKTIPKIDQEVRVRFKKPKPEKHQWYGEILRVIEEDSIDGTAFTAKI